MGLWSKIKAAVRVVVKAVVDWAGNPVDTHTNNAGDVSASLKFRNERPAISHCIPGAASGATGELGYAHFTGTHWNIATPAPASWGQARWHSLPMDARPSPSTM